MVVDKNKLFQILIIFKTVTALSETCGCNSDFKLQCAEAITR